MRNETPRRKNVKMRIPVEVQFYGQADRVSVPPPVFLFLFRNREAVVLPTNAMVSAPRIVHAAGKTRSSAIDTQTSFLNSMYAAQKKSVSATVIASITHWVQFPFFIRDPFLLLNALVNPRQGRCSSEPALSPLGARRDHCGCIRGRGVRAPVRVEHQCSPLMLASPVAFSVSGAPHPSTAASACRRV